MHFSTYCSKSFTPMGGKNEEKIKLSTRRLSLTPDTHPEYCDCRQMAFYFEVKFDSEWIGVNASNSAGNK